VDRAEAHDLADKHPEKVKELADLWLAEAGKNDVLPLNDYGVEGINSLEYKVAPPADGRYVYYPGTTEVPEASAARTLGVSFKILAEVEFAKDSQGVIVSQGSRFGSYTIFVKSGRLKRSTTSSGFRLNRSSTARRRHQTRSSPVKAWQRLR
jgi:arylsulfatase